MKNLLAAALISVSSLAYAGDYSELYKDAVEGTLFIQNKMGDANFGIGTGFVIQDRFIITAAHVVDITKMTEESEVRVHGNDRPGLGFRVKVIYRDLENDTALLEMEPATWNAFLNVENPKKLKLADDEVIAGQDVWGIGNRSGYFLHFYSGNMSKPFAFDYAENTQVHYLDLEFFKGDSGGPILNTDGEVVGMVKSMHNPGITEAYPSDNVEKAITSKQIRKVVNDFVKKGTPLRFEGMDKITLSYDIDGEVYIKEMEENKLANYYGLKIGDREFKFNGTPVNSTEIFRAYLTTVAYGDILTIDWMRDGEPMTKSFNFKP
jgi:serine protease Do